MLDRENKQSVDVCSGFEIKSPKRMSAVKVVVSPPTTDIARSDQSGE